MASSLKKLTGMGGDVRKIARLLQAKAPAGHKLAYINDEEAALLKARGGKGTPHADTGIPSYELDDSFDLQSVDSRDYGDVRAEPSIPSTYAQTSDFADQSFANPAANIYQGQTIPSGPMAGESVYSPIRYSEADLNRISVGRDPFAKITSGSPPLAEPKEQTISDRLSSATGLSKSTLANLGLAGGIALVGSRQAKKAEEAAKGKERQIQQLAAPYQQAGAQMQAQAQRGELTPAAQQQLQAVQAQAAQGAENRGGIGAVQVQQQVEAFRQQLLAQQYDYGLKLSGIGDNIALGAIRTGLQADQYVNQLTNQYYGNVARVAYGSAPQGASTPATRAAGE